VPVGLDRRRGGSAMDRTPQPRHRRCSATECRSGPSADRAAARRPDLVQSRHAADQESGARTWAKAGAWRRGFRARRAAEEGGDVPPRCSKAVSEKCCGGSLSPDVVARSGMPDAISSSRSLPACRECHLRALPGRRDRNRGADPDRRAGDERRGGQASPQTMEAPWRGVRRRYLCSTSVSFVLVAQVWSVLPANILTVASRSPSSTSTRAPPESANGKAPPASSAAIHASIPAEASSP
jgi:hypothetical protein